jgi:hypothetical protein
MIAQPIKDDFDYTFKARVKDWFWPIVRIYRQIGRSLAWARFAWNNYDWDNAYLYDVMIFKMKRMEYALLNGVAEPYREKMKSLKLAIKLAEKLRNEDYHHFTGLHGEKWGELEFVKKVDEKTGREYTGMERSGITPETKEQERSEFMEACRLDDSIKIRDTRWFYGILAKYQDYWWD